MSRYIVISLLVLFSSCSTAELDSNLINVDTWTYSESKLIEGTSLHIREVTEISFREHTFKSISILARDTIVQDSYELKWETKYPNIIRYHLDGDDFYSEIEVVEYSPFMLKIKGLLPRSRISVFKPKMGASSSNR